MRGLDLLSHLGFQGRVGGKITINECIEINLENNLIAVDIVSESHVRQRNEIGSY